MALTDTGGGRVIVQHNGGVALARVTLAGTVKCGDPVGYSSGWKRAAAEGPIQPRFIALQDGVSGDSISVCTEARIKGFTLGTPGATVYVKDNTAGSYAEAASATSTESKSKLGAVVAADEIHVQLDSSGSNDAVVP